VDLILPAIQKRERELVVTTRAKVGQYMKPFAPKLIGWIARKAIEKGR